MFASFPLRIVSLFMSSITSFAGAFASSVPDFRQPPEQLATPIRQHIMDADDYARVNGIKVGIAVIDRANRGRIIWNDRGAHHQYPLAGIAHPIIAGYALRKDPQSATREAHNFSAMMSLSSNEAADRLWKKYGSQRIIEDTSRRYNLQEVTNNSQWGNVSMSAYDMARFYHSFLNDKNVSLGNKKFFLQLLAKSQKNVNGSDISWGLPSTFNFDPTLAWKQGIWNRSAGKILRHTTAVVYEDNVPRGVIVVLAEFPMKMGDDEASRRITELTSLLVPKGTLFSQEDAPNAQVSAWMSQQEKIWKE